MDLSLVVPVYNEELILNTAIREIGSFFSSQPLSWECIVVNDGSTDATGEILNALKEQDGRISAITFPENRGKGAAVKEGFLQSKGDWILFFDADLSTPLKEFDKFWEQKNIHTVLIGSRSHPKSNILTHQTRMKELAGKLGNLLTRLLLPLPFRDTQCGFKLYPGAFRTLLSHSHVNGAAFDIEWLLIAGSHKFEIVEIPVMWTNRPSSRFGPSAYGDALKDMLRIVQRRTRKACHGPPDRV